jgi:hypothetical protein
MPEPIFARLEYHWCSTSRRMRWFLEARTGFVSDSE